ncbi:hypothetical protein VNO77_44153 [Canavalia gladiata]|uniref:Uncharacterized protein n=1 Tax=Canavalia gladiata TaxID=3824 RepID=A0AAN9PQH6_CANGL
MALLFRYHNHLNINEMHIDEVKPHVTPWFLRQSHLPCETLIEAPRSYTLFSFQFAHLLNAKDMVSEILLQRDTFGYGR